MKLLFCLFICLLACIARAQAGASVTLGWMLSSDPGVANQTLSIGIQNGVWTNNWVLPATATTFQVTNLAYSQSYWFAVRATGTNGLSSSYSTPLNYTTTNNVPPPQPPPAPTGLKVISVP